MEELNHDLAKFLPFRDKEVCERVRAIKTDIAVAYGDEHRPGDTSWLTGYDPHIESTVVVIGPKKRYYSLGG